MPSIVFYRQQRQDGGVRTGVEIDRETLVGHFEEGSDAFNPLLTWYVDVECEGPGLPTTEANVRGWLLSHAPMVTGGLRMVADEIGLGHDPDVWSFQREVPNGPEGVRITITCAANRRAESRQLAAIVRTLADDFTAIVDHLMAPEPTTV